MADPRFFRRAGPFSLDQLAKLCGAELSAGADGSLVISDVAPLDKAGEGHISFLDNKKYVESFTRQPRRRLSGASHHGVRARRPAWLCCSLADPYRAYALVARLFYPVPPPEPWILAARLCRCRGGAGRGVLGRAGSLCRGHARSATGA